MIFFHYRVQDVFLFAARQVGDVLSVYGNNTKLAAVPRIRMRREMEKKFATNGTRTH